METKKCTKCGEEKELTTEHFGKLKKSKDGFNPHCKKCIKLYFSAYIKEYFQKNPDKLEEKYLRWKKWAGDNKEHQATRLKTFYQENKKRFIAQQKERYSSDEEYRNKKQKANQLFRKSDKGQSFYNRPDVKERGLEKTRVFRANNKEYVNEQNKGYHHTHKVKRNTESRERTEALTDGYIRRNIIRCNPLIKDIDIPKEVIDLNRKLIQFKRDVRNQKMH